MWIEKKENPPRMLMRWVRQSFGSLHVIEGKGWLFSSINDFWIIRIRILLRP